MGAGRLAGDRGLCLVQHAPIAAAETGKSLSSRQMSGDKQLDDVPSVVLVRDEQAIKMYHAT